MSKSLCNFITINEILKKIDSEELRFFMISGHYRSSLDYSFNNIKQAQHSLKRLYIALHDDGTSNDLSSSSLTIKEESKKYSMQFYEAMNDDFNTPKALSVLFDLARKINQTQDPELKYLLKKLGGILGLLQKSPNKILGNLDITFLDQQIQNLLTKRNLARKKKNWIEADNIRDKLINMGIKINDTKIGMTLHKNSNT